MKHGWRLVALLIGGTIAMTPTSMDARSDVSNNGTPAGQTQAQAKTGGSADAIRPFRGRSPWPGGRGRLARPEIWARITPGTSARRTSRRPAGRRHSGPHEEKTAFDSTDLNLIGGGDV